MTKRRQHAEPIPRWTPIEEEVMRLQYPHMKTRIIAAMLGITEKRAWAKANAMGLTKSPEFLASPLSGRTNGRQGVGTRFVKGQVSWNKGVRYVAGGRSHETRFKPGVRQGVAVKLYKPIGFERVSKDGYLERKVNDDLPLQRRWRAVHLIVWEAANGPLPKGHAVAFRNKDKRDFRLENLELITRAELLARNWHRTVPLAVRQITQLRGAITRQINKRNRRERSTDE
jgi:hypothetical protein